MKRTRCACIVAALAAMLLAGVPANAVLVGQLGVLDVNANGGINPATNNPWQAGDQYRLTFVTSATRNGASADINDYNAFVQTVADSSSLGLSGAPWRAIASTDFVDARTNTGTDPAAGGEAIFLMDGSTVFANNYADLWDGSAQIGSTGVYLAPNLDENGNLLNTRVFAGTTAQGTNTGFRQLGETVPNKGAEIVAETGITNPNTSQRWIVQFNQNINSELSFYALSDPLTVLDEPVGPPPSGPQLIAGVDFEGASMSIFDRTPDDLNPDDGISVSTGTSGQMFDGWTLVQNNGNSANGLLRNDNGANMAGATSPDFPARLEGNTIGSWSIFIPEDVELNLDRIEFDVRGATGGAGRQGAFTTSLEGLNILWEDLNLPGRNAPNAGWMRVTVDLSGELYQGLTNQELAFLWLTNPGPGTGAIDLDTIQVFGSLAAGVPEPATATLALLGLGGLMMRRRRANA